MPDENCVLIRCLMGTSPKARRVVLRASSMCRLHTSVVSTGRLSGVGGL